MYTIVDVPPIKGGYAELYVIGDKHYGIGDEQQDRALIHKVARTVINNNLRAKQPYCYVVGVGDTLDLSIKNKFGEIGKDEAVKTAFRKFRSDFKDLAEMGYYLGDVPGNHDARISGSLGSGLDLVEEWIEEWREAGSLMGYGDPHLILDMNVDKSKFITFITHGSGGGGSAGAVANQMFKNRNELSDFDVCVNGHFHRDIYTVELRPYFDKQTGTVQSQTQHFFTTGSLQKKSGYAAVGRLPNTGTSVLKIKFFAADSGEPKKVDFDVIFGAGGALKNTKVKKGGR